MDYKTIYEFLRKHDKTPKQIDQIWESLKHNNSVVQDLVKQNRNWTDLTSSGLKSLLEIYNRGVI